MAVTAALRRQTGDPHIHIERRHANDDQRILDLLAAEDIHFGALLAYNDPAGHYIALANSLDSPQLRGFGKRSIVARDGRAILSGQEYRSAPYGHLNLYLLDKLVAPGQSYNADNCTTYVWSDEPPVMEGWLRGMARGESFFTSGPLLLLEVDGKRPGAQINKSGAGPHVVTARIRTRCEVAPVTHVQLIANGRLLRQMEVPRSVGLGQWLEMEQTFELEKSAWIAARAYSHSPLGTPDAESHTNPVYVCVNGRQPYEQRSLDRLVAAIDKQIAIHKKRKFAEQAKVVAYFEQARNTLMRVRAVNGIATAGYP